MNQIVLTDDWASLVIDQADANAAAWQSTAMIGVLIFYGIALIWIFAAIRPRFGPGPLTATIAGLTLWAIAWGLLGVSMSLAGMITTKIAWISAILGFFEVPISAFAGAWVYRARGAGNRIGDH